MGLLPLLAQQLRLFSFDFSSIHVQNSNRLAARKGMMRALLVEGNAPLAFKRDGEFWAGDYAGLPYEWVRTPCSLLARGRYCS